MDALDLRYDEVRWKADKQRREDLPESPIAEKALGIEVTTELAIITLIWSWIKEGGHKQKQIAY